MPAVLLEKFSDSFTNTLSINVDRFSENLVGRVILGTKPFDKNVSKYSLIISVVRNTTGHKITPVVKLKL